MLTANMLHNFAKALATAFAVVCLASCSWMDEGEDLAGCPTGDFVVQFVYDYNMQRADMFRDHVGEVQLYVFDEGGKLVTQRTANDAKAIGDRNNRFNITLRAASTPGAADLVAGQKYRFVAVGGQKAGAIVPTAATLPAYDTERAHYRQSLVAPGSSAADYTIALDRSTTLDAYGRHSVSTAAPLDTLWHTLGALRNGVESTNTQYGWTTDSLVTIRPNIADSINVVRYQPQDTLTLSLIRDTKHLHVSLNELDGTGTLNADDYDVFITDANGRLDISNTVLADEPLVYRPYYQRTTDDTNQSGLLSPVAHYDLMFNRVMYNDEMANDARLCIVRKSDGEMVANMSLPRVLTDNGAYSQSLNLKPQGYLDREYNYFLIFFLKNGSWEEPELWIATDIHILAWAVRRQEVEIGH